METIKLWLDSKKITTHTVVVIFGVLAVAYESDGPMKQAVSDFKTHHPHVALWLNFGLIVWAVYKNSNKGEK